MLATGLVAGGAVLNGLGAVKSSTPEGDVDRILSLYGSNLESSKASNGVNHFNMKLTNHAKLCEVLSASDLPFDTIRVTMNNTLEFSHRGQKFSVSHRS